MTSGSASSGSEVHASAGPARPGGPQAVARASGSHRGRRPGGAVRHRDRPPARDRAVRPDPRPTSARATSRKPGLRSRFMARSSGESSTSHWVSRSPPCCRTTRASSSGQAGAEERRRRDARGPVRAATPQRPRNLSSTSDEARVGAQECSRSSAAAGRSTGDGSGEAPSPHARSTPAAWSALPAASAWPASGGPGRSGVPKRSSII